MMTFKAIKRVFIKVLLPGLCFGLCAGWWVHFLGMLFIPEQPDSAGEVTLAALMIAALMYGTFMFVLKSPLYAAFGLLVGVLTSAASRFNKPRILPPLGAALGAAVFQLDNANYPCDLTLVFGAGAGLLVGLWTAWQMRAGSAQVEK